MKPTAVIPAGPVFEKPTSEVPQGPWQVDESILPALEAYVEAKEILANADALLKTAREKLEEALKNRKAVETSKYRVLWVWQNKAGFYTRPTRTRPLRIFKRDK